jgi:hypothetical protein
MVIKKHLCGIRVAYQEGGGLVKPEHCLGLSTGRPQGSLYSFQKKRIADAVAYLQQISREDCRPLIFVATSPGFIDRANEPRFVSKLVHNLRNGYGMEHYVWVREFTGQGFPHFHFVANIPLPKKVYTIAGQRSPFDPVKLSLYWSGLFGSDAKNSIRVGSKPNKYGKRMIYLSNNRRKAWYLSKYIGKSRSSDEVRTKAKLKAFHMDEKTSAAIEPELFTAKYVTETKAISTWNANARKFEDQYFDVATGERVFENQKGELFTAENVNWKYVGHECWTGFDRE